MADGRLATDAHSARAHRARLLRGLLGRRLKTFPLHTGCDTIPRRHMLHQRPTTHAQSRKSDRRKSVTRKNALAKLHVSTTPHHVVHVLSCKRRVQRRIGGARTDRQKRRCPRRPEQLVCAACSSNTPSTRSSPMPHPAQQRRRSVLSSYTCCTVQ